MDYFVNFSVAGRQCSVRSTDVEKVIRVVDIAPVPQSSNNKISGVINMHGAMILVFNMQAIFTGSSREIELSDAIIIVKFDDQKKFGLLVDEIKGIQERKEEGLVHYNDILIGTQTLDGLSTFSDGTILISQMKSFLTGSANDLQKVS